MKKTVGLNYIKYKVGLHTVKLTKDNKYYCTCKNKVCKHVKKIYRR